MALNKKPDDNQSGECTSQFDELETYTDEATEDYTEQTNENEFYNTTETTDDTETSSAVNLEKSDEQTENDTYSSQFSELEGYVDDYNSSDFQGEVSDCVVAEITKKKMSPKKLGAIIGIIIAILAILGVAVYFIFFNNTIKGSWAIDNNGTKIYYTFTNDTLDMSVSNGYMHETMSYPIKHNDDNTISLLEAGQVYQKMIYSVEGNLIQGKKLTLSYEGYEQSETVFDFVWAPEAVTLKGPEFTKNDQIIGYWKSTDGYTSFMEFTDDGSIHNYFVSAAYYDDVEWKYNYDGKSIVTISAGTTDEAGNVTGEGEETTVSATIKGDELTIENSNNTDGITQKNTYVRSTKEEYEEFKKNTLAGKLDPALDSSVIATEITTEATTEADTKAE